MRFVVYGAGAVGGVVGGRLFEHGHEVMLIARGAHYRAIEQDGLTLASPLGTARLKIPVVERPGDVAFGRGDVVLLSVKSQNTPGALDDLAAAAPADIDVVCLQNGVDNERAALRRFENVYGVLVMCVAAHLRPGVVEAYSSPTTGILDIGRYPQGSDETAEAVASAFQASTFSSLACSDIRRWKWAKLLTNLGNAAQALCGTGGEAIAALARDEGVACLRAAGIDFVENDEYRQRRGDLIRVEAVGGQQRAGGSSWQSLARRAGTIESDYLNGEIVLLGRLHGVPTPANDLLRRRSKEAARAGAAPGSLGCADLLAELAATGQA